jgi:hypothetical protein
MVIVVALSFLSGHLPLRYALPAVLALGLGGLAVARPDHAGLRGMAPYLALSVVLALAPALSEFRLPGLYEAAALGLGALGGWAAILWQVGTLQSPVPLGTESRARYPPGWLAVALGVAVTAGAALLHQSVSGDFAILQDEVLYLLQGRWFASAHLGWPLHPELLPSLRPEYTFYREGVLYSQYPPGWPLLLGLLGLAGLRWWASPILAGVTALSTYHLGRRLHSPAAGLLAALLLATHAWFVAQSVGYMSHIAGAACLTTAAMLVLPPRPGAQPGGGSWILAGGLLGLAVAIRPLSGTVMIMTLLLWLAALQPAMGGVWGRRAGAAALGALLPVSGLLWYNAATTGHPLQFGYSAVHGSLHDLGFGLRGFLLHGGNPQPQPVAHLFTPALAAARLGGTLQAVAERLLPVGFLAPLLWLGAWHGLRPAGRLVLPFLLMPAAHYFYFFSAPERFLSELLPFAMAGVGCVLAELVRRGGPGMPWLALLLVVLNTGATARVWHAERLGRGGEVVRRNAEAIAAIRRVAGPVVVLVREPAPEWYQFRRLSLFNADGLGGDVVVARDLGGGAAPLLARLPGRTVYRATLEVPGTPLRLTRLTPPVR